MANKQVVLIGAGKIGRGYMADLFSRAGYALTFLEYSPELVEKLNEQGSYTVFMLSRQTGEHSKFRIGGYRAFCTQTQYEQCLEALAETNYATVHVYPAAGGSAATSSRSTS